MGRLPEQPRGKRRLSLLFAVRASWNLNEKNGRPVPAISLRAYLRRDLAIFLRLDGSMTFAPLELMLDRVSRYGADSDTSMFTELLYAGEFALKLTAAAFIAAVEDDREHHRYRLVHGLVRADGIGEWARALDEVLTGPASQELAPELSDVRRDFTERLGRGSWQHTAVADLHDVLTGVYSGTQALGEKIALRVWFQLFAELRNKTRGHGALTPATCARLLPKLDSSVRLLCATNPVFRLPWAYLHRNLSGRYLVRDLGGDQTAFAKLKTAAAAKGDNYTDGIYISAGRYRRVELIQTDLDVADFFVPNGAFRNGTYELHSLISDSRLKGDGSSYLMPARERPPSETEGKGELDVIGRAFSNLPPGTPGYVRRPELEAEVRSILINDRHPIVTLVGRGGIGKTSLALTLLREIAETDRYDVIVWFSARDIDLTAAGAKPVQPRVLTDKEIADQYRDLIGAKQGGSEEKVQSTALMAEHLHKSPLGSTLFVFDNFETVRSPVDLFQWIDTNIRLPNKAVITSRFREFKADYPIEVLGMEQDEAEILISQTSRFLSIENLIGKKERDSIIEDSNGHPYVIKIMLGEIANAGTFSKPGNLIARKEDILDALFERTYANLSPIAARIFLTLSGWRSLVPQLAVEAVLLRHGEAGGDPEEGIDQLVRMSLIERVSAGDGADFLEVPLTAALFGKRKLEVSPIRAVIETDMRFLQDIGATATSGLKAGIRPRVEAFFKKTARSIAAGKANLDEVRPILEFLARGHPPAWLLLSELEQEAGGHTGIDAAAEYVRRFLESKPSFAEAGAAWQRLVFLYRATGDVLGGCDAFLKAAESTEPPLYEVSDMANWLNNSAEVRDGVEIADRSAVFKPLARLMEERLAEATATDLSRLAWLHLHSGDARRSLEVADLGLERDPTNIHCQRLVAKLREEANLNQR